MIHTFNKTLTSEKYFWEVYSFIIKQPCNHTQIVEIWKGRFMIMKKYIYNYAVRNTRRYAFCHLMLSLSGGVISLIVLGMAFYMIVHASRILKNTDLIIPASASNETSRSTGMPHLPGWWRKRNRLHTKYILLVLLKIFSRDCTITVNPF